jgi:CRISPR-associated endonuclease/helicase Cas3
MFGSALGLTADQSPFPWQDVLLSRLSDCTGNRLALDVPTGLGKTSVIAAWLVALARQADLPRRLVYVVRLKKKAVYTRKRRAEQSLRACLVSRACE